MDPHHSRNDNQLINNALFSDARASLRRIQSRSRARPRPGTCVLPAFPHIADRIDLVSGNVVTTTH